MMMSISGAKAENEFLEAVQGSLRDVSSVDP
jgi:hypothetical protein